MYSATGSTADMQSELESGFTSQYIVPLHAWACFLTGLTMHTRTHTPKQPGMLGAFSVSSYVRMEYTAVLEVP